MFNKTELEKILVKNWTVFLEIRKAMEFVKTMASKELKLKNPKIKKLSVSNCSFTDRGLIIWLESNIISSSQSVNTTTEILIRHNKNIEHIKTI